MGLPKLKKKKIGIPKTIYLVNFSPIFNANKTILFLDYYKLKNKCLTMLLILVFELDRGCLNTITKFNSSNMHISNGQVSE